MSKSRKTFEGEMEEVARYRFISECIEAEEEKLGKFEPIPFKGKPFVFDEKNPGRVTTVVQFPNWRNMTPEDTQNYIREAAEEIAPELVKAMRPADNPKHRFRHGLDGAYDHDCDDICCRPARLA